MESSGQYASNPNLIKDKDKNERNQYVEKYLSRLEAEKFVGVGQRKGSSQGLLRVEKDQGQFFNENNAKKNEGSKLISYVEYKKNITTEILKKGQNVQDFDRAGSKDNIKKEALGSKNNGLSKAKKHDLEDDNDIDQIMDVQKKIQEIDNKKKRLLKKMNYSSESISTSPKNEKNYNHNKDRLSEVPKIKRRVSEKADLGGNLAHPLMNLYEGERNLMRKYKQEMNDMKDLYRDVLYNLQPVDYDKEDMKIVEEKIRQEEEMFEISEVNSIKEDTIDEKQRKSRNENKLQNDFDNEFEYNYQYKQDVAQEKNSNQEIPVVMIESMGFDQFVQSIFEEEFGHSMDIVKKKTRQNLDGYMKKREIPDLDILVDSVRLESDKPVDDGLVLLMSIV